MTDIRFKYGLNRHYNHKEKRIAKKEELLNNLKERGYIILNEEKIKSNQQIGTMVRAGYIKKEIEEPPEAEGFYSVAGYNYDNEIEAEVWIYHDKPIDSSQLEQRFIELINECYPPNNGAGGGYGLTQTNEELNERIVASSEEELERRMKNKNLYQGKLVFNGSQEFCAMSRVPYGELDLTRCANLEN